MNITFKEIAFLLLTQTIIVQFTGCASTQTAVSEVNPLNTPVTITPDNNNTINATEKVNSELEKNKSLWKKKNIVDYDLNASLFKGGSSVYAEPVLIKVRNGEITSVDVLNEKFKQLPVEEDIKEYRELGTVEKLFDEIQKALNADVYVEVKYDKIYGYPYDMRISYFKGAGTDHGRTMIINRFEVIKK